MSITPELIAHSMLSMKEVSEEKEGSLFLEDAIVVILDNLVVFKGDLNMESAIPKLKVLSEAYGLPIAVIEDSIASKYKLMAGDNVGPGLYMQNSWSSTEGLDFGLKEKYNEDGTERKTNINKMTKDQPEVVETVRDKLRKDIYQRFGAYGFNEEDYDDNYGRYWNGRY